MKWRPISDLTDNDLDVKFQLRLVLANSCNGPLMPGIAQYWSAEEVQNEGCWTHFLILPEIHDDRGAE